MASSPPLLVTFFGGTEGRWEVERIDAVRGETLAPVRRVAVFEGAVIRQNQAADWVLHGVTSNERYVTRREQDMLVARQQPLGRPTATKAALIPVRKSGAWWDLPQDERRSIFEDKSRHVATGLEYLPAVARRLHHCRDLGEPWDFLTWFEYAPDYEDAFDELVDRLRATEEWSFVEREVDVRLRRVDG